jgi:hypothetical protein
MRYVHYQSVKLLSYSTITEFFASAVKSFDSSNSTAQPVRVSWTPVQSMTDSMMTEKLLIPMEENRCADVTVHVSVTSFVSFYAYLAC